MIYYISRVGIQPLLSAKCAADVLFAREKKPLSFYQGEKTVLSGYVV
jgi:hypothetical protein